MKVNKKNLLSGTMMAVAIAFAISALLPATKAKANETSINIYGNVDVGIQSFDTGTDTVTRTTSGKHTTSRLGLQMSSPLVEEMKVVGTLEGLLDATEGEFGSTSSTGGTFNREASIALTGPMGTVKAGKTDVTKANDLDSAFWSTGNFTLIPKSATLELGGDQSNVFKYISPKLNGFTVEVGGSFNANDATSDSNDKLKGVSATYEGEMFSIGAGRVVQDGATTAAEKDATAIAIATKVGDVLLGVSHVYGDNSSTADVKSTATLYRVKMPINNTTALTGVYGQSKDETQSTTLNEGTGYAVIVEKKLFADVTLYGAYTSVDNDANSSMTMAGLGTVSAGADASGFTAGINYKF